MKKKKMKLLAALLCIAVLGTMSACGRREIGPDGKYIDMKNLSADRSENLSADSENTGGEDEIQGNLDMDKYLRSTLPGPCSMVFTGDVLFQDNITSAYDRKGLSGILSPDLQKRMQEADLSMINEEFPFGTGGTKAPDKQFTFKADPSYVKAFQEMGVDIVSLANNHVLDYGKDVLSQTFTTLDGAGIPYVGAGETKERAMECESFTLNGTKVGILCASRVIPVADWDIRNGQPGVFTTYDPTDLVAQIKAAEKENDLVVVYVHWGIEKAETPEAYQRELAKQYIDAGADLVIGSHPHVLQGIEYYKGVPVVYSLGNFMFHETISKTAMLQVDADENQKLSLKIVPAAASNSLTYEMEGQQAQDLYDYMEQISFGVDIDAQGNVSEK